MLNVGNAEIQFLSHASCFGHYMCSFTITKGKLCGLGLFDILMDVIVTAVFSESQNTASKLVVGI